MPSELATGIQGATAQMAELARRPMRFMEVCGTHSMSVARYGLRQLLPAGVELISGPGCPVCVTSAAEIDAAIALAERPDVVVATFGDMVRVPGSRESLATARARGGRVQVIYSPMQAVELAAAQRDTQVCLIAVGFETTMPGIACAVTEAADRDLDNFSLLCAGKLIPPVLEALIRDGTVALDGLMCPGHVSAIIGANAYRPLAADLGIPCVIAGFEPQEIMRALLALVRQVAGSRAEVENAYPRVVTARGNEKALALMAEVFEPCDTAWRGMGVIAGSGLRLRDAYRGFDAVERLGVTLTPMRENAACHCGEVLRGAIRPRQCPSFGAACTPQAPLGPCMVSSEGACAAAYRYG